MKKEIVAVAVFAVLAGLFILVKPLIDNWGENKMIEIVVLETSKGNIEIQVDKASAPITAANFLRYANEGFYNETIFHRVIPNFMVQGGGFTINGKEKQTHEPIKLESRNGLKNTRGTIAMARTNDPDSATGQFFINLIDNDFLNYAPGNDGYAVFGNVTRGMGVVDSIVAVKTENRGYFSDWPVEDVIIKGVYAKKG